MNAILGVSIAGLFSANLISRLSDSLVQKGINTASYIKSGSGCYEKIEAINEKITTLDVRIKLKVLRKFLLKPKKNAIEEDLTEDLADMVYECEELLINIQKAIEDHETKWFKRYRVFDVVEDMEKLEKYNFILRNRVKMLVLQ